MEGLIEIGSGSWEYRVAGRLLEFSVKDGKFSYYDGPEEPTARSHEAGGGSFEPMEFFERKLLRDVYPELYPRLFELVSEHEQDQRE